MDREANGIVTIGPAPVDPDAHESMVSMRDGVRLPNKPVGTGPFMYKSFSPGRESTFVRNPN